METPETIRTSLQQREWVTSIDFKDAYFHIPMQEQSRRFHIQGRTYQFKTLPFGLSKAPMVFTVVAKEVKLISIHKGIRIHQYLDDWLVRARSRQVCLQHTQYLVKMCQQLGWLVNIEKSELEPKTGLPFYSLPVRPQVQSGQANTGPVAEPSTKKTKQKKKKNTDKTIHVLDRSVDCHRKTSSSRSTAYDTHPVASQKHLEGTRNTRKGDSYPQVPTPPSTMVAGRRQCIHRPTITPNKHVLQIFTDASKEGWCALLDEHTARGTWFLPESKLHY